MARVHVREQWSATAWIRLTRNPTGGVARDMMRRGLNVEARSKQALMEPPKRVDNGRLRASIGTRQIFRNGVPGAAVGTSVFYAIYVLRGTGIFGPRRARIRPKRAKVLAWRSKSGQMIFRKSVAGMKPNPFLITGLQAAKD